MPPVKRKAKPPEAESYIHPESESPMRPDVGTQAQFKKKKPPVTYRYDSSLSPALDWDGQNPARELGEWLLSMIDQAAALPPPHTFDKPQTFVNSSGKVVASVAGLQEAIAQFKAISKPFLNWAGKAERLSFDVPTLPLFVHERLSTKAIVDTLVSHKRDKQQTMFELFGDPQHSVTDQVLRAYEHRDKWVNRVVLGDSLAVMNSLLHYEGLGGQVQMIYMDPPYGVKFGSNFQPFVRKRDVTHGDDEDMTREPEMVQAYRDTWELGLHSYLTYLRDRVLVARDLLTPSGSIFVQINDENLHHVRELMNEVFGDQNFVAMITFQTATNQNTKTIQRLYDHLVWYARSSEIVRCTQLYRLRTPEEVENIFNNVEDDDRRFKLAQMKEYSQDEKNRLRSAGRLTSDEQYSKRYSDDFQFTELDNVWFGTVISTFSKEKLYVVQTSRPVVERCMLMTTAPGELVLDPTCGSGTTAYVAEQWGRRWITIDTSRVPLALARQRLLTATFPWYELNEESRGPAGGFVYKRKQNKKGEEVGGIVPHITLESIAKDEPPKEEVLVDRPEVDNKITRVTGPFCVEATIPTPVDWEGDGIEDSGTVSAEERGSFVDRMLEVLRKSPVLRLEGNRTVTLRNVRPPAKTLSLSAEALVDATAPGQTPSLQDAVKEAAEKNGKALPLSAKPVALVFGPENGAVSEKLVYEAAREAHAKGYSHLYVIGFAIQSHARELVEKCLEVVGILATYVQATPDIMMGDLLKNMRSSQIFSVCGLPEVKVRRVKAKTKTEAQSYEVEVLGLDVFDPVTMEVQHRKGDDVPAWFLDTDYNALCFHVSQAFFPRTAAWDSLKKALKGQYEERVWEHLAGTVSAPFEAGQHGQVAVKVIDDRGNELLVVKPLSEAKG